MPLSLSYSISHLQSYERGRTARAVKPGRFSGFMWFCCGGYRHVMASESRSMVRAMEIAEPMFSLLKQLRTAVQNV